MKNIVGFVLAALAVLFCWVGAFSSTPKNKSTKSKSEKVTVKVIPPGTVQVEENLFMDVTELTNIAYKEYLYYLKTTFGETSAEYQRATFTHPEQVTTTESHQKIKIEDYFKSPAYLDYPVLGLTYPQVTAYCAWRTRVVNEQIYRESNRLSLEDPIPSEIPQTVHYRLPTKEEWLKTACSGIKRQDLRKINKSHIPYRILDEVLVFGNFKESNLDSPLNAYSGVPNNAGCYNMFGNVNEYIAETGQSIGGNYHNEIGNFEPEVAANESLAVTGFRCVAEIQQ